MLKEFDNYTKALQEFQEYQKNYNEQVQKLKGQIKDLESKKSKIELEITEKLINGQEVNYNEVEKLQKTIDTLNRQLLSMKNYRKQDKKLQKLADDVMNEFKALKEFERKVLNEYAKEMERLKDEYEKKTSELQQKKWEIQAYVRQLSSPRGQALDYVSDAITKSDINRFRISC